MSYEQEHQEMIENIGYLVTKPYCYGCQKLAPEGVCKSCGSDDLMRYMEGVGVDYGTHWAGVQHIHQECQAVDTEDHFEEYLNECYGSVEIAWILEETGYLIRTHYPEDFRIALCDHESMMREDNEWIEVGGKTYQVGDVQGLLDDLEVEAA